jgi:hydroxymethylpyrimidine/phosphomethylpyrimidine kinase
MVEVVAETLKRHSTLPLVVDPVMVAKGGAALLQKQAVETLKAKLLPRAELITPNIPEAELLSGQSIRNAADMKKTAEWLLGLGPKAVLLKGGHLENADTIYNILLSASGAFEFTQTRISTRHTHGTGCTLASAIATGLAQGMSLKESAERGFDYVEKAIKAAPGFGQGYGPLKHNFMIK